VRFAYPTNLRTRLTLWYVAVLAALLLFYAALVFAFQYVVLTKQIFHDEVQDVVTVEGLLYFDAQGALQLRQDYYSRPQSHLLVDRMMEVRDPSGEVLYRSPTLQGMPLGGPIRPGEGDAGFDEHIVRLPDGSHVFLISHVHAMQGRTMVIRLGYNLAPLRARMIQFLAVLLIAIPLALITAGIAGQLIARRALRPVELMARRAAGITASNLDHRLEIVNPNDELGNMGGAFNHLLDRLEQAFAQLQRFTADAAHELRTPIAALRATGEVALASEGAPATYREALGSILEETGRLNETIESLLLLARVEAARPEDPQTTFSLAALVDEVLEVLEVVIEERGITVAQHVPDKLAHIRGDRPLLRIAIMNVVHNAVKFSPDGSTITISYREGVARTDAIVLSVRDQGPGIGPGEHETVFERFYVGTQRPESERSGTGLGLSIARLILDRLGGRIWFERDDSQGAECVMEFPSIPSAPHSAPESLA